MNNSTLRTVEPVVVTHRTRTNVFVFYTDAERPFVPLLEALLELHGHRASSVLVTPYADPLVRERARAALEESGAVVLVLGAESILSPWARVEIQAFHAAAPDDPVIPVLLGLASPDWLPSVATRPPVEFGPCLLSGFKELFAVLGSRFLARDDLREPAPAPVERRREARRTSGIRQRLQTGLLLAYCREAERSVFERITISPAEMSALETALSREVQRYEYDDPADGRAVDPLLALRRATLRVAQELGEGSDLEIVRAIRAVADQLCLLHTVRRVDRRRADRRNR